MAEKLVKDSPGLVKDLVNDCISRQAAIDAVKKNTFRLTFAEEQNCEGHLAWSANAVYSDVIEGALLELPSAQPETTERTTETAQNVSDGDLISRKAAIDALRAMQTYKLFAGDDLLLIDQAGAQTELMMLPSAQPEKEKAKRVLWTGWKGYWDTRYKCPNCKKPVKNDDIYCHRCGQRLMFPHISFTDCIPGKKQETIVRWDDE